MAMRPAAWFGLSIRPWRPNPVRWMMQDLAGVARQPEQAHRTHLRATLEWLCRAQDACRPTPGSGCGAAGWTSQSGWLSGAYDDGWMPAATHVCVAGSWSGPGASGFDALNAKHFADVLMMDMVGIAIPPVAQIVGST